MTLKEIEKEFDEKYKEWIFGNLLTPLDKEKYEHQKKFLRAKITELLEGLRGKILEKGRKSIK